MFTLLSLNLSKFVVQVRIDKSLDRRIKDRIKLLSIPEINKSLKTYSGKLSDDSWNEKGGNRGSSDGKSFLSLFQFLFFIYIWIGIRNMTVSRNQYVNKLMFLIRKDNVNRGKSWRVLQGGCRQRIVRQRSH